MTQHLNEYSLEDEDTGIPGTPPEEPEKENPPEKDGQTPSCFRLLLSMMVNPIEGWKEIRRNDINSDEVAKNCFFPIAALSAASCFMQLFYNASSSPETCLISGIKIFMALFFGNFLTILLFKIGLPKEYRNIGDSNFGKIFVMYNLSTLGLFYILYELLPMLGPVLVFLPLWTIYLTMRGCRFFRFTEEKGSLLKTLICLFLLGAPIAVYWAFDILL